MPLLVAFDSQFMDRTMSTANRLFYDNIVERRPDNPRVREAMAWIKRDFVAVETKGI
ncbi:hypothetical protein [Bradyrhizobium sp. CCBAU 11357]|uniref:hypothetical protein n=1 Tax=Bradyrhizobium sp. CCBAU 11357 TaxID=1630808 RepID=UPI0023021406|nr:hypothetical protein [Bradyrhizobium sp. CCBAU 11357]